MKQYKFTIKLGGVSYITSELIDKLYEAGCNDGLINQKNGGVYLDFDRRATSYGAAIQEAIYQIEYIVLNDGSEIEVLEVLRGIE